MECQLEKPFPVPDGLIQRRDEQSETRARCHKLLARCHLLATCHLERQGKS